MTGIYVRGWGAVSPAGWGVAALWEAVAHARALPLETPGPPGAPPLPVMHPIPPPPRPLEVWNHPRVRRSSPITRYGLAAACEALGIDVELRTPSVPRRLGMILSVTTGCVNYTRRFYEEVRDDPARASPLIFPETVFNAPLSHLAAVLGVSADCFTLVGDEGAFLQALALGAEWLLDRELEAVLVWGAEEPDGLVAGAQRLFTRRSIHAAGAGALVLAPAPAGTSAGVALERVTEAFTYSPRQPPGVAARRMRAQCPRGDHQEWLIGSARGDPKADAAEQDAWSDWPGPVIFPLRRLGAAFNAAAAWQAVLACEAIHRRVTPAATVSVVGTNQQAIGARWLAVR